MIQLLNFEPQMVFHSTAIHTLDLSSCVLLFAEGFFVAFQGNFYYRFGLERMVLAGILDTKVYLKIYKGTGSGEGLEINFLDILGS